MSLITLIKKFGQWIAHFWEVSEKVYNDLTEFEKKVSDQASGIIALVNQYGGEALPYIKLAYPELSDNVIQGFTGKLLNALHVVDENVPLTLEDALKDLAGYLSKHTGSAWVQQVQGAANILASIFSPDTPIQKFISTAEYNYQEIVAPKLATSAPCEPGYVRDANGNCVKEGGPK